MSRPATKKTDNSYLSIKIRLRKDNLPEGDFDLRVLDCFAGSGRIWREIKRQLPERKIEILSIDQKKQGGIYLRGDNVKYLKSLDLTQFDIIDLDAWGIPYKQLKIIFSKRPGTILFVTFIRSMFGRIPVGLLRDLGFSSKMIRKCPTLFDRHGWEKFKLWLAMNGITQISGYSHRQKHYIRFILKNSQPVKFEKMQTYRKVRKKAK